MSQHAPPFSSVLPSPCDRRICPAFRTILPLAACSSVLPPAISAPFAHLHPSICASSMARRGVAWPQGSRRQTATSLRLQLLPPEYSSITAVEPQVLMGHGRPSSPGRDLLLPVNAQNIACARHPTVLPIMSSSQAPSNDCNLPPSSIRAQGYGIRTRANTQAEVAPRLPRPRRSSSTFANFARPPQPSAAWSLQGLGLLARSSPRREEHALYT